MRKKMVLVATASLLAACQTPPDIQQLQNEKAGLQNQLVQANSQITQLKADEANLQRELAERDRVIGVLNSEKNSRVVTSTQLRGQVRQFVQQQVDALKSFLLEGNLLDYIGGELVARTAVDEQPLLVVDLANTVPKDGSLTSVGGYFIRAGSLRVKVMRKVEDNLVVVWESQTLAINDAGLQKVGFSVSVGVQQGDVVAYYLSDPGMVGFDTGTGNSRYIKEDVSFGKAIRQSSLLGEQQRRAYSLGVYGLLDTQ
ncbi:hypothetical protein NO559_15330 [Dasania sp. GY-MA-18]|uniref:Uncharacterized protein n=1 Tax=Dasania phycosphaerae TaxID=2950436 RepID=A0A9J6RRD2_9GAMM|nr:MULTISPECIES: hypothetical protein [Dasania]MCR8924155.1 hypothetical protein [Dasania sp. GY-MA-18]MCZ0866728.1 hypothetical protein [Dasania phycosphaerae]MCZ0870313.1 hypothetical protein [Dasania phycosphaerae]